jgi:hypothetical protein
MASLTRLIAFCVTSEKMSSLSPGMTKDQVISLHGRPDGYQAEWSTAERNTPEADSNLTQTEFKG